MKKFARGIGMSKSRRIMELMMTINRKRKFTVRELAAQFDVSPRTILRDLQELSELGVPLYSEVGPHGGYQVLNERVLPPITFTEDEAVAMFFSCHALRHYTSLPFEAQAASALNKFFHYLPNDVKDRIDQMRNRVDFITPTRIEAAPFLAILLDGAIDQKMIRIEYDSREGVSQRDIQPVGIYANNGFWYCPAYCHLREDMRLFRVDRIRSAEYSASQAEARELKHVHLGNWKSYIREEPQWVYINVELSREGVRRCQAELWPAPTLQTRADGTGVLSGMVPKNELPYFSAFFIGLGKGAKVKEPEELVVMIRQSLREIMGMYEHEQ
jgi:predicted DNA-binding transcriptional regulator YafY